MDNILSLQIDLQSKTYTHGSYHAFNISDPKPRNIHKASVRDRLLHHAIYRVLYPYFDNQEILLSMLKSHKLDENTIWLLEKVIHSFNSHNLNSNFLIYDVSLYKKGLPLGNLTSQLLVNIYMNEFDQYVKHRLKVKHYIRYADDFVIFSPNKDYLLSILQYIERYLNQKLKLTLHPSKIHIKTLSSGVDFLGWVHFPHHRVLRSVTKRRMIGKLKNNPTKESKQSYLGLLIHGDTWKLRKINFID
ncbi:MAG TPA: RNA-directed DNA polymerase [Candidatus Paceibacterota bacterium]